MAAAGTAGLETSRYFNKPSTNTPYELTQPKQTTTPSTITQPETSNQPEPIKPLSTKEIILKVARDNGLKDEELAQFLGQCAHESANFTELEENLNYSKRALRNRFPNLFPNDQLAAAYENKPKEIANYVYANKNGNGNQVSGDGYRYRGRGFIHLTGKANYAKAAEALGIDLVSNPDLAADPEIAADIALWYWRIRVKPKVSGKYSDTKGVTRQINPGLTGLKSREAYYQQFKSL
jgi:putative chitinase